jgi:hypothetical protein
MQNASPLGPLEHRADFSARNFKYIRPKLREQIVAMFDLKTERMQVYRDAGPIGKVLLRLGGRGTSRASFTGSDAIKRFQRKTGKLVVREADPCHSDPQTAMRIEVALTVESEEGVEKLLKKGSLVFVSKQFDANTVEITFKDKESGFYTAQMDKSLLSIFEKQFSHKVVSEPVFEQGELPDFTDINQGGLGDCYFDAALTSLTRRDPEFVRNMVVDNGDTVSIRFFLPSPNEMDPPVETWITVEKSVVVSDQGKATFTKDRTGTANWSSYVEKAFAALKGAYPAIAGGHAEDAFPILTGGTGKAVSLSHSSKQPQGFWAFGFSELTNNQKFIEAMRQKFPDLSDADMLIWKATIIENGARIIGDIRGEIKGPVRRPYPSPKLIANIINRTDLSEVGKDYMITTFSDRVERFENDIWEDITEHVYTEKSLVTAQTYEWRTEKTGEAQSGEDTRSVPGLADRHVYEVFGTSEEDGVKFVHIRNPWGHSGFTYDELGKMTPSSKADSIVRMDDFVTYYTAYQVGQLPPVDI